MKENKNIILEKTFHFSVRIVNLVKYLQEQKKEYILSKQICRSGTSIGANAEEAVGGSSRADFTHKLSIAYRESRETDYWLRLLFATDYIAESEFKSLHSDCKEISRILFRIIETARNK